MPPPIIKGEIGKSIKDNIPVTEALTAGGTTCSLHCLGRILRTNF